MHETHYTPEQLAQLEARRELTPEEVQRTHEIFVTFIDAVIVLRTRRADAVSLPLSERSCS